MAYHQNVRTAQLGLSRLLLIVRTHRERRPCAKVPLDGLPRCYVWSLIQVCHVPVRHPMWPADPYVGAASPDLRLQAQLHFGITGNN